MEETDDSTTIRQLSSANAPLHQLSPERMNIPPRIPQSPSFNSYLNENDRPKQHQHRDSVSSDVQSRIAFLNGLNSANTSPTRKPLGLNGAMTGSAALQRAVLGYEEAQATMASLTAELERYKQASEQNKRRERMVAERIESLIEDVQTEKSKRGADKEVYVKEIKKARKDTYKSELAQLEVREELKEAKAELKKVLAELAHEREEKERARQEAFERAYALAGLTEETELLKERLNLVEQERDAALLHTQRLEAQAETKAQLSETATQTDDEQIITDSLSIHRTPPSQAQTEDATPTSQKTKPPFNRMENTIDSDTTPKPTRTLPVIESEAPKSASVLTIEDKRPTDIMSQFAALDRQYQYLEGEEMTTEDQILFLKDELARIKRQHQDAAETIHFLHIQCQFKACPCRVAERSGKRYVYDHEYDRQQQARALKKRKIEEENRKAAILPPEPGNRIDVQSDSMPAVEEVARIPLPSPAMDIDSPEVTGNLEELTQVLVETGPTTEPFRFSVSMSSNNHFASSTSTPARNHNTSTAVEGDLFNLSPPRSAIPRPATSLGILNCESPIRLVPQSPQTVVSKSKPISPFRNSFQMSSTVTKIALKDSPQRQHRRTQSKPDIRSRSRGRSPLVFSSAPDEAESEAGSPASTTYFPVTPRIKQARSQHNLIRSAAHNSTTITIPIHDTDVENHRGSWSVRPHSALDGHYRSSTSSTDMLVHDPKIPGTPISREEALAQIRARRDRARSINMKKDAIGNLSKGVAPESVKRNGNSKDALVSVNGNGNVDRGRDISQASAPGRFGF